MDGNLERCERDVEAARARLAGDLRVLRRPETVESFTRAIKVELITSKDAAIESVKTSAFGAVSETIDKLKSKAAANPEALLAIGAGLAWHFVKNPPIVSALVGAGLFSLLKTPAPALPPEDLIGQGGERLKEQVGEFAVMAKEAAQSATDVVTQKVSDVARAGMQVAADAADAVTGRVARVGDQFTDQVKERAQQITGQVTDQVTQATSRGMEAVGDLVGQVRRTRHDVTDTIRNGVDATGNAVRQAVADAPKLVPEAPSQDTILLGIAGVAVAAALGLALQRASNET